MLEVRHLRLVKAVAETGALRRAADRLNLSQPALSRQLSGIERRLGTPLFYRLPRLSLTPAGEEVLAAAKVILERIEGLERKLDRVRKGSAGLLRLSTECHTCYHWLPARLELFRRDHPNVDVEIVAEATSNPLPWLLDGRLDLAIVSSEPSLDSCAKKALFTDELAAILSPDHPLAEKSHLEASDFASEHLYVYNWPPEANRIFQRLLIPAGVRPQKVTGMPLTEATLELVKCGLGIAFLARWAVAQALAEGTLVALPVTSKGLPRKWEAVWRRDGAPAFLPAFLDLLASAPFAQTKPRRSG